MARYIDADALLNALKEERKNGNFVFTSKWIKEIIDNLPPADVVPKSEVERFAEEIKLEFYREFDEIIPSIMADKIDEIKKKYTESEDTQ